MKINILITMKKLTFFIFLFLLCLMITTKPTFSQSSIQTNQKYDWEKIILLVTKKAEVEKFFGKPILEQNGIIGVYQIREGKLLVWYAGAKDAGLICDWQVTVDTVVTYEVSLSEGLILSKTEFDLNKFEKTSGDDGGTTYTYAEKGISFTAFDKENGEEIILVIKYNPPANNIKQKCKSDKYC